MENELNFINSGAGDIVIDKKDNLDNIINIIIENRKYDTLETGIGLSFSSEFIANAMFAGFYITSYLLNNNTLYYADADTEGGNNVFLPILNLWKTQTVLFFDNLHESKNVSRKLKNYELKINYDFINTLDNIIKRYGNIWITPPLQEALKKLNKENGKTQAISFEVYKNGELKAGEIGIKTGKIYTSYSGFYNESSAGSVQLALMLNYLKNNNYEFCNFGTDDSERNNAYKRKLGAVYIDRLDFIKLWRNGRLK